MSTINKKPPTIFIELVDRRGSGFIQDDTDGATKVELDCPSVRFIPNTGFRRVKKIATDRDGKEIEIDFNEAIRYIKNEPEIRVEMQNKLNIQPSPRASEDKIPIEKGSAIIVKEGATAGLYDYIHDVFFNENAPNRSEKATVLYRIVEMDKQQQLEIDNEMLAADALKYVASLYEKRGSEYFFEEAKIDGICTLFTIIASSYTSKLGALTMLAKQQPESFMKKVLNWEGSTAEEVAFAIKLNILKFDANVAQYTNKNKIITSLGTKKNMSLEEKIDRLADFLRTKEGHQPYMDLKAEIKTEQNKIL